MSVEKCRVVKMHNAPTFLDHSNVNVTLVIQGMDLNVQV